RLFDAALARSWDAGRGGMYYGFAPESRRQPGMDGPAIAGDSFVCDDDKYFWVQAESLAAAALLARRFDEQAYRDWYQRLWVYAWAHMVDHRHGAWYRILDADNRKYGDEKSPAGKVDYHTMGACYEVLAASKRWSAAGRRAGCGPPALLRGNMRRGDVRDCPATNSDRSRR